MKRQPSLQLCILLDLIGCIPFLVPFVGYVFDLIWAPVSAIIFYFLFGGRKAMFGAVFSLVEETLPFVNFIPTFTIAWLYRRYLQKPATTIQVKPV